MRSLHYIVKYAAIALAVLLVVGVLAGVIHLLSYLLPCCLQMSRVNSRTYEIRNEITALKIEVHLVDLEILTATDGSFRGGKQL